MFVDEINRGNVARILGELISLIEPSKRLGAADEMIVTLPYSRRRFGVPSNLHLVGTMNTADRSVEALDAALRRRFAFQECPPRPELLAFEVEGGVHVGEMLRAINARLRRLVDRDHVVGHAYFMHLADDRSLDALKRVFRDAIVPLLQEYFYGDWGRIGLVLGDAFVRRRDRDVPLARFEHDDADRLASRSTYELVPVDDLTNLDFQSIYADG